MELRQLETVVAVVDEGSITRAAQRLHLAQPAVSRRIARLERELGVVLFERTTVGVVPSAAAHRLAAGARSLLAAADRLVDAVRDGDGPRRGVGDPTPGMADPARHRTVVRTPDGRTRCAHHHAHADAVQAEDLVVAGWGSILC